MQAGRLTVSTVPNTVLCHATVTKAFPSAPRSAQATGLQHSRPRPQPRIGVLAAAHCPGSRIRGGRAGRRGRGQRRGARRAHGGGVRGSPGHGHGPGPGHRGVRPVPIVRSSSEPSGSPATPPFEPPLTPCPFSASGWSDHLTKVVGSARGAGRVRELGAPALRAAHEGRRGRLPLRPAGPRVAA